MWLQAGYDVSIDAKRRTKQYYWCFREHTYGVQNVCKMASCQLHHQVCQSDVIIVDNRGTFTNRISGLPHILLHEKCCNLVDIITRHVVTQVPYIH